TPHSRIISNCPFVALRRTMLPESVFAFVPPTPGAFDEPTCIRRRPPRTGGRHRGGGGSPCCAAPSCPEDRSIRVSRDVLGTLPTATAFELAGVLHSMYDAEVKS